MAQQTPRSTPRQRYLEDRQRKQSVAFSVTGAFLAAAVVCSLAVLTGVVTLPLTNDFARGADYATIGDIPCPSPSSRPPDPASITVQVLNATSQQGIAADATNMLTDAGFTTVEAANTEAQVISAAEIDVGPRGVDAGYSVARLFPDARITLTDAEDATVTVILGSFYEGTLTAEDSAAALENTSMMSGDPDCKVVDTEMLTSQSGTQSGEQSGDQSGSQSGSGQ